MPKVSVIVPNYNHERFLRQRIDSILAQTFQDFELILLDDCSTDGSRSILSLYSSDPHVHAIEFNQKNSGSTFKQWNKGVRLARGEYVWIAESDDYADSHFLERLVPVLDSKPEIVLASCRSWQVNADGQIGGYADSHLPWVTHYVTGAEIDGREECRDHLLRFTVWSTSSVLFRKSAYQSIGGADESMRLCGEWKAWATMALAGRIAYLPDTLNHHRLHPTTVTGSISGFLVQAERLRALRSIVGKVNLSPSALDELHRDVYWLAVPAVSVLNMPIRTRLSILRGAVAIDPAGTFRWLLPECFGALRRKFANQWHQVAQSREKVYPK